MGVDSAILVVKFGDDDFRVYEYCASTGIPDLDYVKANRSSNSLENAMIYATNYHAEHGIEYKDIAAEKLKQQEYQEFVNLILGALGTIGTVAVKDNRLLNDSYILTTANGSANITIEPVDD